MNTLGSRYRNKITGGNRVPSVTDKIFSWYYKCSVPSFHSRTVEDIRQNGVVVTGIRDLDEGLKNDWIRKWLTINSMIEFYKRGVPVKVIDVKDTKDIYQTIQTHLVQWLELIRVGINIGDAPMDDLIAMDRFAAVIYPYAKYLITPEALESALADHISATQRVNIMNFFSNAPKPTHGITRINPIDGHKTNKVEIPERESFSEHFQKSALSLRRY